ncbi:MAG: pilus assembly protein N-terminal domain-containing protein [Planctomycetales bacterium]|nr:pilus assembly protein N-terminal domain-containing protein [Planctomycetales bacterium]
MHEMPSSHTANLSPCGPRRRCATLALLALLGGLVASGAHSAAAEPIASGMTLRAVAPVTGTSASHDTNAPTTPGTARLRVPLAADGPSQATLTLRSADAPASSNPQNPTAERPAEQGATLRLTAPAGVASTAAPIERILLGASAAAPGATFSKVPAADQPPGTGTASSQRRARTPQLPSTTTARDTAAASDVISAVHETTVSDADEMHRARTVAHSLTDERNVSAHVYSDDTYETHRYDGVNTAAFADDDTLAPAAASPAGSSQPPVQLVAVPPPGTRMTLTPLAGTEAEPVAPVESTGPALTAPTRGRAAQTAARLTQFAEAEPDEHTPVEMRGPFEVIDDSGELKVMLHRSKLLRTKVDIYRTAVVDPRVCNVVQFTPREISVIGVAQGATHVTFWFEDGQHEPLTYLVRVEPDPDVQKRREEQYRVLEDMLAELFPNSKVELLPVSDKLLVKGQARDAEEAAQIMAIIRGQAIWGNYRSGQAYGGIVEGSAAPPLIGQEEAPRVPAGTVINMLKIPGEQQVMLRVKIAELNRTAARRFGVDLDISIDDGNLVIQSMLNAASGSTASIIGMFDGDDVNFGIHYLEQHGVLRLLSEPTLVTLSGRPASFLAGGEFAVPTTVGVGGAAAVTTDFRAFGAIITFMPIVLDKDLIRLQVSPEFSQVNNQLTVGNTPGLNTRSVSTTVEMREGQTLAIAGLLDDAMTGNLTSDLPWVSHLLGRRHVTHNETELVILVTPELVHPLDPEEVPPLPGFDVTEPTNTELFLKGRLEGNPTLDYRSTIWPRLRSRYTNGGPAMISGPFGHGQ